MPGYFVFALHFCCHRDRLIKEVLMPWAIYRQDFHGNKFTVGVDGTYTTRQGEKIRVTELESEAAANEAAKRIDDSHFHNHKAYYLPIHYETGRESETFKHENIQIM